MGLESCLIRKIIFLKHLFLLEKTEFLLTISHKFSHENFNFFIPDKSSFYILPGLCHDSGWWWREL